LVVQTNVVSTSTTLIKRISPLCFMIYDEKPKKFNGFSFERNQKKMLFYLTTSKLSDNEFNPTIMATMDT